MTKELGDLSSQPRENVLPAKRRSLQQELDGLVANLDKTSLRGCHCKLDQVKLLRAEAEVLADDYELDASEVTTRTEVITAEEKQVCAELEEMAVTSARVCARDVARLEMALTEPGLDGSIRDGMLPRMLLDVRDRVLKLGELSVIAARAKAREVAELEVRSQLPTSVRKAAQLALHLWVRCARWRPRPRHSRHWNCQRSSRWGRNPKMSRMRSHYS
jgi:hypothetical protein